MTKATIAIFVTLALFSGVAKCEKALRPFTSDSNETKGCISGSIGRVKGMPWNTGQTWDTVKMSFTMQIRDANSKDVALIAYRHEKPDSKRNDFNTEMHFGKVFSSCLTAGDYFITRIEMPGTFETFFSKQSFKIPLHIEAGKNLYVGSFSLLIIDELGPYKNTRKIKYFKVELTDSSERDIPLIMSSKVAPASIPVVKLLEPDADNQYFVKLRN